MEYMMEVNTGLCDSFKKYGVDWEKENIFIEELIYGKKAEVNFSEVTYHINECPSFICICAMDLFCQCNPSGAHNCVGGKNVVG